MSDVAAYSGQKVDSLQALDTTRADQDIFHITDHWLIALEVEVERNKQILEQIKFMKKY